MKKTYFTPIARVLTLEAEDTILAYSNITINGEGVEGGDGSDASNQRGWFAGGMWDNME